MEDRKCAETDGYIYYFSEKSLENKVENHKMQSDFRFSEEKLHILSKNLNTQSNKGAFLVGKINEGENRKAILPASNTSK